VTEITFAHPFIKTLSTVENTASSSPQHTIEENPEGKRGNLESVHGVEGVKTVTLHHGAAVWRNKEEPIYW